MAVVLLTSHDRHSHYGQRIAALAERVPHATVVATSGAGWEDATHVDDWSGAADQAVAFGWRACMHLGRIDARAYAYHVPYLEDAALYHGDEQRLLAALSYDLPLTLLVDSDAVAGALRDRSGATVVKVLRGFAKDGGAPARADSGTLRVLLAQPAAEVVERAGGAIEAVEFRGAVRAEAFAGADVLLELPPADVPLDLAPAAMQAGCVPVVVPTRGHDEYVSDGVDGVVVDFDDVPGTATALTLLARDRELLARLREGALARAATLPSLDDEAARFREVLGELRGDSQMPRRLLLNARMAIEPVVAERRALERRIHETDAEIAARGAEYRVGRTLRPLWRPLRALVRLLRRLRG